MFDRVDAGADRRADARRAMGVGGDAQPPLMRLVGDRAQLVLGQLLLAGLGVAREDAAGGADLDHLGAIFALAREPGMRSSSGLSPMPSSLPSFSRLGGRKVLSQWPPVAPSA